MKDRERKAGLLATLVISAGVAVSCKGGADAGPARTPFIPSNQPVSSEQMPIADSTPTLSPTPALSPSPELTPMISPSPEITPTPVPSEQKTTLIVYGAHPDDEAFGAAGAVAQSKMAGNKNMIIIVTDGEGTAAAKKFGFNLAQVAKARETEATYAWSVVGLKPTFLKEPDSDPDHGIGVQKDFVMKDIEKRVAENPGNLVFMGHSTDDPYYGLPHGNPDHYVIALALEEEYERGVIKDLREYTIGQYAGATSTSTVTKPHGICQVLPPKILKIKRDIISAYRRYNPAEGRYAIAHWSVPDMMNNATKASMPECYTLPPDRPSKNAAFNPAAEKVVAAAIYSAFGHPRKAEPQLGAA